MSAALSRARILVVEDEVIVARDIQQQLCERGYTLVGHATRGAEAIRLAVEQRPDLVLMDIQLSGGMDGIEVAQTLRRQLALPVVFMTAFCADEFLERAQLSEPFGYILKPFSERELYTVIEMALYKHRAEVKLLESAQHNQAILENMLDGVITIDTQGRIESFNKAASSLFGYTADEAIGRNVSMLMPDIHRHQHDGYLQRYLREGTARLLNRARDFQGLRKDGSLFPISLLVSKIEQAERITFIGLVRDTTQHQHDMEEIRRLAFYDALTSLPNRRLLMDRLKHAMLSSQRSREHGALMFLDLDHFKLLNDSLGHDVGDELLQQVALRLLSCVRECDSVARLGGDEFVVLLEALSVQPHEAASQAEVVASKILQSLGQPYRLREHDYSSTPSIGVVVFMDQHATIEELLKTADVAMYQAKAAGRNTLRFFDPTMQAAAVARAKLELDLRQGLIDKEFVLHYQIQVRGDGLTTGVEALVRWNNRERGLVAPGLFIPLAEETGVILSLGQWVLESACQQLQRWSHNPHTAAWNMAVNVSASQFAQADFVACVDRALQLSGANPQLLTLELTESMLVANVDDVISKMNQLKARGVSFSLDDFGTGYSSLSFLKHLPLEHLKIDQSFVRDLLTDPSDAEIARTIIMLGHSLGMQVIAEGVETAAQRDYLLQVGCDVFQGYYFGRPQAFP